jgi:hypothetical protein
MSQQPPVGHGLLIIEASRSHSDTPHFLGRLWTSDRPIAETSTWKHTTLPCRDSNPAIPASKRPQTHTLEHAATVISNKALTFCFWLLDECQWRSAIWSVTGSCCKIYSEFRSLRVSQKETCFSHHRNTLQTGLVRRTVELKTPYFSRFSICQMFPCDKNETHYNLFFAECNAGVDYTGCHSPPPPPSQIVCHCDVEAQVSVWEISQVAFYWCVRTVCTSADISGQRLVVSIWWTAWPVQVKSLWPAYLHDLL